MRSVALLFVLAHVANSFVLPIKLASTIKEQAEVLTFQDRVWTTNVIIGTPGKVFTVVLDTASSFLYVPDVSSGRNNTFDPKQSSSYLNSTNTFHVNGRYGQATGIIGLDTVVLGGSFNNSVTVVNATFGQDTTIPHNLPANVDGILGLAFQSLAPRNTIPPFQQAINQNVLSKGIYTIWLEDQWATSDNGTHGVVYYGNNDALHCKTNETDFYPLSSATYFQFTTTSATTNINNKTYTYNTKTQTIIESTSDFIAAPQNFVSNVLRELGLPTNSQLPATVPCNSKIDLAFNFPGRTQHVTELNLLMQHHDGTCRLALLQSNHNNGMSFEFGIPFLRGRCTYFDQAGHQIGFSDPLTHGSHFGN